MARHLKNSYRRSIKNYKGAERAAKMAADYAEFCKEQEKDMPKSTTCSGPVGSKFFYQQLKLKPSNEWREIIEPEQERHFDGHPVRFVMRQKTDWKEYRDFKRARRVQAQPRKVA